MFKIHPSALEFLINYHWPGNVRELRNFVEKMAVLSSSPVISREEVEMLLRDSSIEEGAPEEKIFFETLGSAREKAERDLILTKLLVNNWNYEKTAEELGISRATLFNKIKKYGITREKINY